MKRKQLFHAIAAFSVACPRRVVAGAFLLCLLSLMGAARFMEVRTSNLDLIDPSLPPVRNFLDSAREFGTPNVLVLVIEDGNASARAEAVDRLEPLLRIVPGIRSVVGRMPLAPERLAAAGVDPYLTSRDRGLFMLYIQPEDTHTRVEVIDPLLAHIREAIASAGLEEIGVRAGLTGIPQYAIDDRDVIQRDIRFLSLVSFVLIGVLFLGAFAAMRMPLLAMITLGAAVVATIGVVTVFPGHLTLLSAFFASILFGLGIDYGIHLINRTEEFIRQGLAENEAVVRASEALAPELTTGALTTAAVFLSMMLSGFRGFEELGFIAGAGVLVCLLAMISLLPALLALFPNRRDHYHANRGSRMGHLLMTLQRPFIAVTVGVVCLALSAIGVPAFDGNYMNLQPENSETVRLERALVEQSNLSPQFAVFTIDDPARAVALADRLLDDPTVGEVRSISDLEMLAPVDGSDGAWPASFVRGFRSEAGRYAVYAYPAGNVWETEAQERFVGAMQAYDPEVAGMPVLGKFMVERSQRALLVTGAVGGVLLLLCVWVNFRRFLPALVCVVPTFLTAAAMQGMLKLAGITYNPLNIMALPVILGIAVDNGVHIVHRYMAENGDIPHVLAGSGRSVVLTSLTTMAAFGTLAFTSHRGLASFAIVLVVGVTLALLLSVLLLPWLLQRLRRRILAAGQ